LRVYTRLPRLRSFVVLRTTAVVLPLRTRTPFCRVVRATFYRAIRCSGDRCHVYACVCRTFRVLRTFRGCVTLLARLLRVYTAVIHGHTHADRCRVRSLCVPLPPGCDFARRCRGLLYHGATLYLYCRVPCRVVAFYAFTFSRVDFTAPADRTTTRCRCTFTRYRFCVVIAAPATTCAFTTRWVPHMPRLPRLLLPAYLPSQLPFGLHPYRSFSFVRLPYVCVCVAVAAFRGGFCFRSRSTFCVGYAHGYRTLCVDYTIPHTFCLPAYRYRTTLRVPVAARSFSDRSLILPAARARAFALRAAHLHFGRYRALHATTPFCVADFAARPAVAFITRAFYLSRSVAGSWFADCALPTCPHPTNARGSRRFTCTATPPVGSFDFLMFRLCCVCVRTTVVLPFTFTDTLSVARRTTGFGWMRYYSSARTTALPPRAPVTHTRCWILLPFRALPFLPGSRLVRTTRCMLRFTPDCAYYTARLPTAYTPFAACLPLCRCCLIYATFAAVPHRACHFHRALLFFAFAFIVRVHTRSFTFARSAVTFCWLRFSLLCVLHVGSVAFVHPHPAFTRFVAVVTFPFCRCGLPALAAAALLPAAVTVRLRHWIYMPPFAAAAFYHNVVTQHCCYTFARITAPLPRACRYVGYFAGLLPRSRFVTCL